MKYFKMIGIMSLLVFSFYLTDLVTELAVNSNPLMKIIKDSSSEYKVESVNAIIENNTIIPGIKGKNVDELESFLKMKDFGTFNINHLIYKSVEPEISLKDNLDKVIISGNKSIRQVSILVKNVNQINYLEKNKIKYSKLNSDISDINEDENINIISDFKKFNDLDTILNKRKLNKNICIIGYSNIDACKKNKYYLVKPSLYFSNNNIVGKLKDISNGSIILIDDNLSINNLYIIIDKINRLDLKIVYLSEIIKE